MTTFATDLNHRERQRYAESADELAAAATKLAEALRAADDSEALVHLLLLALRGPSLTKDLGRIFKDAAEATKAAKDLDEGPPPPQEARRDR